MTTIKFEHLKQKAMTKKHIIYLLSFFILAACNKQTASVVEEAKDMTMESKEEFRSMAPKAGEARPINLGTYENFQLDNGLDVILVENHKLPRVSFQLSLNHNPITEGDQVGFVSMAGDLMATGTSNRTKAEIDAAVDFLGARLNTSSRGVFASCLTKHQDALLDVFTDVLYNPSFPESEFEKLKKQTISGIQSSRTDPNAIAGNVASVLRYGKDHPYGEVQTEKHVENISLESCKNYYNSYFKPNNASLIIVGDITLEQAKKVVMEKFGSWQSSEVKDVNYDMPKSPDGAQVAFVNKDGAVQSVINITYPVDLKPGAPDAIPASVMNSILGGGIFSGRLMQNLREDKAYTYGARSSLSRDRLVGNFNAFASVRNEVTDSSVHEFLFEMNRLISEDVSEEDLQLVKNSMTGSFARSLESPQTIARFARNIKRFNLPQDYYATYLQKLNAVSVADIKAMAMKYIKPDNANILVVGSKDDVAEKLLRFDTDGEIDYYDAFGNILDMSKAAALGDVDGKTVISDYLDAIGGKEKLMSINTMSQKMEFDMMGQTASIESKMKNPSKMAFKVNAMGMVMQEVKFNGEKAQMSQMGQSKTYTEGAEFDGLAKQAQMFPQMSYMDEAYTVEFKGVEKVGDSDCYKLKITDPNGDVKTEFYSLEKNLLLKSVETDEANGQQMTISTEYKDYQVVDGVSFPHTMVTTGMMPVPMEMKVVSLELNNEIDDATFNIE